MIEGASAGRCLRQEPQSSRSSRGIAPTSLAAKGQQHQQRQPQTGFPVQETASEARPGRGERQDPSRCRSFESSTRHCSERCRSVPESAKDRASQPSDPCAQHHLLIGATYRDSCFTWQSPLLTCLVVADWCLNLQTDRSAYKLDQFPEWLGRAQHPHQPSSSWPQLSPTAAQNSRGSRWTD